MMTFKTIFFLMFAILVLLFVVTYFTKKKSKNLSQMEIMYFEKAMKFKKSPQDQTLLQEAQEAAKNYGQAKGLSENEIQQLIQNDLVQN
jgi:signal transduction histidine kinase